MSRFNRTASLFVYGLLLSLALARCQRQYGDQRRDKGEVD